MAGLTCKACNKKFEDEDEQKLHNKSKWHRYNLRRKAAGVAGVTETQFLARKAALADEKKKLYNCDDLDPYCCFMCDVKHDTIESCIVHMHKRHNLFIPDLRHKSMSLAIAQTREHAVRMNVLKAMNKSSVEAMRSKIGIKSNVIRKLPKNVPY